MVEDDEARSRGETQGDNISGSSQEDRSIPAGSLTRNQQLVPDVIFPT
jgi:hypothetical protein